MKILSSKEYYAIHPDFRGVWSGISGLPEFIGRRTVLGGSIGLEIGSLLLEGQSFLIDDDQGRPFFPPQATAD